MKSRSHSSALLTLIALVAAIGAACGGGGSGTPAGPYYGYQIFQFSAARAFIRTETSTDSYANPAGRYRIRFMPVTGSALTALLAAGANSGKSACWNCQFNNTASVTTQPAVSDCR